MGRGLVVMKDYCGWMKVGRGLVVIKDYCRVDESGACLSRYEGLPPGR